MQNALWSASCGCAQTQMNHYYLQTKPGTSEILQMKLQKKSSR